MVEKRSTNVIIKLIDGTIIKAKTNIRNYNRLSDFLNASEDQFLILYEASMSEYGDGVVFVNKGQIIWAKPIE